MITWNLNDKENDCILSNNNLTADCSKGSYPSVRCTIPKKEGKWYFELTYKQIYNNGFGICTKDFSFSDWLGGSSKSYVYFGHKGEWWSNGSSKSLTQKIAKIGDILGILLDCDNKTLQSVINGELQNDKINYTLDGEVYVVFGKVASARGNVKGTANFGATPFNLYLKNNQLWDNLTSKGYKPYDDKNNFCVKYLLKQNNQYYTIKSQFYDEKMYKPCTEDYKANGFEDLNLLTQNNEFYNVIKKSNNNIFEFDLNNDIAKIEMT